MADAPDDTSDAFPPVRIGEAAQLTDLSVRTLRHWDVVGLVVPQGRTDGNYRLYTEDDLRLLRLVRYMKPLGLGVEEMRQLMDLREEFLTGDPSQLPNDGKETFALLEEFVERADQRSRRLMTYLSEVLEFAAQLRLELRTGSAVLGLGKLSPTGTTDADESG